MAAIKTDKRLADMALVKIFTAVGAGRSTAEGMEDRLQDGRGYGLALAFLPPKQLLKPRFCL